jgi:hypothetical protein
VNTFDKKYLIKFGVVTVTGYDEVVFLIRNTLFEPPLLELSYVIVLIEGGRVSTVVVTKFVVTRLGRVRRFDVATRLILFVKIPPVKPTREAVSFVKRRAVYPILIPCMPV